MIGRVFDSPWSAIPAVIAAWIVFNIWGGIWDGWFFLSRRFRKRSEPRGETRSAGPLFYSVYLRLLSHFPGIIRFIASQDGLYLSVLLPFRPGHPPLFIPWDEIDICRKDFVGSARHKIALTLGNEEKIPIHMTERMADKLGILGRIHETDSIPTEPNFDTLSESFVKSLEKKSD